MEPPREIITETGAASDPGSDPMSLTKSESYRGFEGSGKSSKWPYVGLGADTEYEHAIKIKEETKKLLEFSSRQNGSQHCPISILSAYCYSVGHFIDTYLHSLENNSQQSTGSPEMCSNEGDKVQARYQIEHFDGARSDDFEMFGVLVHFVPTSFALDDLQTTTERLRSDNMGYIPGIAIGPIAWLNPEWLMDRRHGSLVVFFERPDHANAAIKQGLLIGDAVYKCKYYGSDCQLDQCYTCQQYGHTYERCENAPVCGRCALGHFTSQCPDRNVEIGVHCALCDGPHVTWNRVCSVRRAQHDRLRVPRNLCPDAYVEPIESDELRDALLRVQDPPYTPEYKREYRARRYRKGKSGGDERCPCGEEWRTCDYEDSDYDHTPPKRPDVPVLRIQTDRLTIAPTKDEDDLPDEDSDDFVNPSPTSPSSPVKRVEPWRQSVEAPTPGDLPVLDNRGRTPSIASDAQQQNEDPPRPAEQLHYGPVTPPQIFSQEPLVYDADMGDLEI